MTGWKKIPHSGKGKEVPYYLEIREGKYKTSYRVNYRAHGLKIRQTLEGEFDSWKRALEAADKIIYKARFGDRPESKALMRCEDIARQLIEESAGQDPATIDGKRRILEKHLVPWLNEYYPYAHELTVRTWPEYKLHKRKGDPTIALENHVKYFRMLAHRAFDLGCVKPRLVIKFDLKKEEFREEGMFIPPEERAKLREAANFRKSLNADGTPSHGQGHRVWYCRIVIQEDTGMRPGEVRNLRKAPALAANGKKMLPSNVEFQMGEGGKPVSATIRLFEEDTKTHRYREFLVTAPRGLDALWERANRNLESPYFFPMLTDPTRPMDKHLNGWKAVLRKAGLSPKYTPHDLRHSYATEMFQRTSNHAALCYQLDMSLETAARVYLHLDAKDTRGLADLSASRDTNPTQNSPTEMLSAHVTKKTGGVL